MSWTPIHHATPDKPEVIKLARILNLSTDDILGKLVRFWIWVDVNFVDTTGINLNELVIHTIITVTDIDFEQAPGANDET